MLTHTLCTTDHVAGLGASPEVKICLLGAAPDTTNLGVSALCYSTLAALARRLPRVRVTVFDNGWGARGTSLNVGGKSFAFVLCGGRLSRRWYRPESYRNIAVNWRLGRIHSSELQALASADAVLDISGGDSFCDMYGTHVFRANTILKQIILEHRIPLILLPQTYGPFETPRRKDIARAIVHGAAMAWARDQRSFQSLRELLGDKFDPLRHYCGVDQAFALEPIEPISLPEHLVAWLAHRNRPLVGFNVSGLIYNDPDGMVHRYGFKADYRQVVVGFLDRLLKSTDCNVVMIPHVLTADPCIESDKDAACAVIDALGSKASERVLSLQGGYGPAEAKWIISQMDWFCGTRMHANIAALSSGVPAAGIAYSLKAAGVFESCNQGDALVDPRCMGTGETIENLWAVWQRRSSAAGVLRNALPDVFKQVNAQMDCLSAALAEMAMERIWRLKS